MVAIGKVSSGNARALDVSGRVQISNGITMPGVTSQTVTFGISDVVNAGALAGSYGNVMHYITATANAPGTYTSTISQTLYGQGIIITPGSMNGNLSGQTNTVYKGGTLTMQGGNGPLNQSTNNGSGSCAQFGGDVVIASGITNLGGNTPASWVHGGDIKFIMQVPGQLVQPSTTQQEVMRIDGLTMNVGIGKTNPNTTLDVNGSMNASGITANGQGGLLPIGAILLWSGSIATIPTGWFLCNGGNGTPNMQNQFIVGAGSSYGVGAQGGANSVTLATGHLPSHTHTGNSGTGNQNVLHTHGGTTGGMNQNWNHNHTQYVGNRDDGNMTSCWGQYPPGDGPGAMDNGCYYSGTDTNHTHNFGTGTESAWHVHGFGFTTDATGGGAAFSTVPPYYALAYIMKAQ